MTATETPLPPPRTIDWGAAALAGIIAGAGFAAIEIFLNVIVLRGPLAQQVRMTAAIVLGEDVLAPDARFDPGVMLVALAVHLTLSVVYTIVLTWIILRLDLGTAELIGLVFGLLLYFINFYVLAGFFPWFREERNWLSILSHAAFGLIAALEYKAFARRRKELGG